jgi:hypothetical protein
MLRLSSRFLFFGGLLVLLLPYGTCHGQNTTDCEGQYARGVRFSRTFFMPTVRLDSVAHEDRLFQNTQVPITSYFFSALPVPIVSSADTLQLLISETSSLPERLDRWVKARYGKLCPTHVRAVDPFASERRAFVMVETARFFKKINHGSVSYWQYPLAGEAMYLGATRFALPNPQYRPWFHKRERAFFHLPVKVYYVLTLE